MERQDCRIKILLIDDDVDEFVMIREMLAETMISNVELQWADSYESGLSRVCREGFDVCLLDYRLGGRRTGLALLKELRQEGCGTPVILLTGYGSYDIDLQAMQAGASDYLTKDQINPSVLERSIRYAVDRQRREHQLRQSEDLFRFLYEQAPMGYQSLDANGRIIAVNQAWLDVLGYEREEVVGKWFGEFLAPPYQEILREKLRCLRNVDEIRCVEFCMVRKDGIRLVVSFNGKVGRDCKGGFQRILCTFQDVTTLKEMENELRRAHEDLEMRVRERTAQLVEANEALHESEHIARATLNALSASIAILDPDGVIICTNDSWRELARTNGSPDSVGLNYLAACDNAAGIWGEDARVAAAGIRDVIAGRTEEFHMEYPCPAGREKRWFNMRVTRFKDHEPVRVVVAYEDITDRKLAEDALEQQSVRMQTVLDNIPAGVIMSEAESLKPVLVNRRAGEILGRRMPHEISVYELASHLQMFRAGSDEPYPVERNPFVRALSGETSAVDDIEVRRPEGSAVRLEVFGAPVRDAAGRVTATVTIFRDITMRKKTASELRSLSARLLTAQEEERKRIANELHDSIGALLSAIKFSMERTREQMEDGKFTPEALNDPILTVQYAVEEVRRIMGDLRPFMIDDLGIIPTISWFCRQFETIHKNIRIEKEITVEEDDVPEDLKIVIFRIMQEAFHNITKHSKANTVNLSLRKAADSIELVVADNGAGFDMAAVGRRENGKGGIGLTSMRERAELLGGKFAIESRVGKGTTACASWSQGQ